VSAHGAVALSSFGVTKLFPIIDGRSVWRVLLTSQVAHSVLAVDNVSMTVPKGTIVGVLGRNGAGKSTLLRLFGGVYTPTSGEVHRSGPTAGLFELGGMGHRSLSGREYARRALILQGAPREAIRDLLEAIRTFTEIGPAFEQPLYSYSAGMAARLYFASATAMPHDVYLIDELLAVGDEHFQAKCWAHLRKRLSGGASGILVTHDWTAVLRLCTQSHIMDRGRIVASGSPDQIVKQYLALDRPAAEVARFAASNPRQYVLEAGEDAEVVFDVEVLEPKPIALAYSIEQLIPGEAWDILLLRDNLPLAVGSGRYRVRLQFPRLPLPAGHYYFNVFLTSPRSPDLGGAIEHYDVRGWTYGNGLDLVVSGASSRAAVTPPLEWDAIEAAEAVR
jgi:homopolymeric O-antigen transport system ATP-binding protein